MSKKTPNTIDIHVGSQIRARRLKLAISQPALADAIGVTFQQVQKYENGSNRISAGRLQQIAQLLGVSASFFFEGNLPDSNTSSMEAVLVPSTGQLLVFAATPDSLALAKAFTRIGNVKVRRRIIDLIEQIAHRDV